jgi:CRISPR-associated protein Csd1
MILQALYQLAKDERLIDDPDYDWKPVPWLVIVDANGDGARVISTRSGPAVGKGADPGKVRRIPRQLPRRSGTKPPPEFLVDNALFTFGLGTEDKPVKEPEKAKSRAAAFREGVERCAESTGDKAAAAIAQYLASVHAGKIAVCLDPETRSNDLFGFVYGPDEDQLVTDRPAVESYWRGLRAGRSTDSLGLCLVSGRIGKLADTHKSLKNLPGSVGTGAAVVSFNSNAFESYGWKRHENAAISAEVAEACGISLTRLLHTAFPDPNQPGQTLPRRHIRLSGDTVVCYWTAGGVTNDFASIFDALLESNPERVGELYRSIWKGRISDLTDATPFYALTMSGAQGRAVVRDWIESTVARVAENLAQHFFDIDIVRNTPPPKGRPLPPQMPLKELLDATVPENDTAAGPMVRQVVEAVFQGYVYPLALVQQALLRERAEIGRDKWIYHVRRDARAAIIKAVLNRRKRFHQETTQYKEIETTMDPTSSSEGYSLGRLLAVLENLQQLAVPGVNASLVDRYFSGASATPKSVFVRLLRNARHHVSKARDDPQRGGRAFLLDRLIDELAGRFSPKENGFPAHLDLEQQGLFVLGYHQMRHWLWMGNEEREGWEREHPESPRAYLWKSARAAAAE